MHKAKQLGFSDKQIAMAVQRCVSILLPLHFHFSSELSLFCSLPSVPLCKFPPIFDPSRSPVLLTTESSLPLQHGTGSEEAASRLVDIARGEAN